MAFVILFHVVVFIGGVLLILNWKADEVENRTLRMFGTIFIIISTIGFISMFDSETECAGIEKYLSNPEQFEVDTIKHSTGIIEYKVTYKE